MNPLIAAKNIKGVIKFLNDKGIPVPEIPLPDIPEPPNINDIEKLIKYLNELFDQKIKDILQLSNKSKDEIKKEIDILKQKFNNLVQDLKDKKVMAEKLMLQYKALAMQEYNNLGGKLEEIIDVELPQIPQLPSAEELMSLAKDIIPTAKKLIKNLKLPIPEDVQLIINKMSDGFSLGLEVSQLDKKELADKMKDSMKNAIKESKEENKKLTEEQKQKIQNESASLREKTKEQFNTKRKNKY